MARRKHVDDFKPNKIISKLLEERNVTSLAQNFGIEKIDVSRAWRPSKPHVQLDERFSICSHRTINRRCSTSQNVVSSGIQGQIAFTDFPVFN
ncbi:hypothetical protein AVEN_94715-1 [Araneus ventricosus]|uniref:Uncharacterized protein n=1 Tax=Araneus ventricosus TaxID=182803 RepID=A0A4Y2CNU2_ARAVE|nr:hypothetical protein AVEN_94715-1 [Araneus ventricosus]